MDLGGSALQHFFWLHLYLQVTPSPPHVIKEQARVPDPQILACCRHLFLITMSISCTTRAKAGLMSPSDRLPSRMCPPLNSHSYLLFFPVAVVIWPSWPSPSGHFPFPVTLESDSEAVLRHILSAHEPSMAPHCLDFKF